MLRLEKATEKWPHEWFWTKVETKKRGSLEPLFASGWEMGFEPTTLGTTIRYSNQLSYTHHLD